MSSSDSSVVSSYSNGVTDVALIYDVTARLYELLIISLRLAR